MPKIISAPFPEGPGKIRVVADLPGEFLNMIVHEGVLFVLTAGGVFRMGLSGKLVRVQFAPSETLYIAPDDGTLQPR